MDSNTFLMLWVASGAVLAGIVTIRSWWQGESTTLGDLGTMVMITITGPVAWMLLIITIAIEMIKLHINSDTVIIRGRNTDKEW